MKRRLLSLIVCVMLLLNLAIRPLHAQSLSLVIPPLYLADAATSSPNDLITQLETKILPELEKILFPDQIEQFKTSVANGSSFRKAFKSLMLKPEQKTQLKSLLSSMTKKDAFASLTPEQKKQLFLKKKEMFMPTSEEITDKINADMKGKGTSLPDGIKEKIDVSLKKKDAFMANP